MTIHELVLAIGEKHKDNDFVLRPPLIADQVSAFEEQIGFVLPEEFRTFYSICNGFQTNEDIFQIIPVEEIVENQEIKKGLSFSFAEYMIYSETWSLTFVGENVYEIANDSFGRTVLTSSLAEFLEHYLAGDVFDPGGLNDWINEV